MAQRPILDAAGADGDGRGGGGERGEQPGIQEHAEAAGGGDAAPGCRGRGDGAADRPAGGDGGARGREEKGGI